MLAVRDFVREENCGVDETPCPICLSPLDNASGVAMLTTTCGHRFCAGCLGASAQRSPKCPLCRSALHDCKGEQPESCELCTAKVRNRQRVHGKSMPRSSLTGSDPCIRALNTDSEVRRFC